MSLYSKTDLRHSALNFATPYCSISPLCLSPSFFSTSISTGRPCVSQPGLTVNLEAAHGLVAADKIFNRPGKNVMDTGFAVSGRGTFVKRVVGRILAGFDAFFKDLILFPVVRESPSRDPAGSLCRISA